MATIFCQVLLKNIYFWCAQLGYLYFLSFRLLNEPGLGAQIDPGIALTPFPSSIGWESIPQPYNHGSSLLTTRPDFHPFLIFFGRRKWKKKLFPCEPKALLVHFLADPALFVSPLLYIFWCANSLSSSKVRVRACVCVCECVWVWECVCCECAHVLCTKQARIYYTS